MFRKLLEISSFLFFAVFHLTEAEVTTYTHFDGEVGGGRLRGSVLLTILWFVQPVEGSNQCWRFTWVGDADETTDTNIGCDSFFPDDLCFEPIVFTNSSGSGGIGPDLVDLTDQCQSKNVTGDCKCDLSASEVCVKYTKFLKWAISMIHHLVMWCFSRNGVPVYYSSFCGSGVNRNNFDTHAVTSGCHKYVCCGGW